MRKTEFAGLTRIERNDNPSTDGAAFYDKDRAVIDHYLEIGAVSHRHDAHAALVNPSSSATASAQTQGGSIGASVSVHVGYTAIDADGGETVLSPITTVTTPAPMDGPLTAPSAVADYTAGMLLAGSYYYEITLTDGQGGETTPSPWASVDIAPGNASGRVLLSNLTADFAQNGAVAWRLYRSKSGGPFHFIASGAGTTFTDDGTKCAACDTQPPTVSTTRATNRIVVTVPPLPSGAVSFNVYGSRDGSFANPAVLSGPHPVASAGAALTYTQLAFLDGSPPDVSTAVRGAAKINAETDLVNLHWLAPVTASAGLPSGAVGDARLVLDTGRRWSVLGPGTGLPGGAGWTGEGIGHIVEDETVVRPQRAKLDFRGDAVTVTDDAGGDRTIVTVASAASASVEAWTPVGSGGSSYSNGWGPYGADIPPRFYKHAGRVYVEGEIGGGTTTVDAVICTLPVGYRPERRQILPAITSLTEGVVTVRVNTDGTVRVGASGLNSTYDYLSLSWRAA